MMELAFGAMVFVKNVVGLIASMTMRTINLLKRKTAEPGSVREKSLLKERCMSL